MSKKNPQEKEEQPVVESKSDLYKLRGYIGLMDDIKTGCPGVAQETVLHREGHTVPRAKASSQKVYDVVKTRIAE